MNAADCSPALFLSNIIIACINNLNPTNSSVIKTLNNLASAGFFMTLGSTLLTTLLIVYRIHSVVSQNAMHRTHSPFQNILDLVVQSAALYAVVCLLYAIEGALPQSLGNGRTVYSLQYYTGAVFSIVSVRLSHCFSRCKYT